MKERERDSFVFIVEMSVNMCIRDLDVVGYVLGPNFKHGPGSPPMLRGDAVMWLTLVSQGQTALGGQLIGLSQRIHCSSYP